MAFIGTPLPNVEHEALLESLHALASSQHSEKEKILELLKSFAAVIPASAKDIVMKIRV